MASWLNFGGRFGRQGNKGNNGQQTNQQPSPTSPLNLASPGSQIPSPPAQQPSSPAPLQRSMPDRTISSDSMSSRKPPFYFREENSGLIVKGNFMTLAAKPEHVEKAEWLAHQVVEQIRLLDIMLKVIQEVDQKTGAPICNPSVCPHMTAASNTIYTWLDSHKNPIRIPASQYITLVQRWMVGKINDRRSFPTDTNIPPPVTSNSPANAGASANNTQVASGSTNPNAPVSQLSGQEWLGKSSGFPESFENDIKNLYRQMLRCYAHMYYAHWLDPFYHLSFYKELNTCFLHFVNAGKKFDLLYDKDLAPMQPLVDIWQAQGLIGEQVSTETQEPVSAAA